MFFKINVFTTMGFSHQLAARGQMPYLTSTRKIIHCSLFFCTHHEGKGGAPFTKAEKVKLTKVDLILF